MVAPLKARAITTAAMMVNSPEGFNNSFFFERNSGFIVEETLQVDTFPLL
jgi:hypothetical protein